MKRIALAGACLAAGLTAAGVTLDRHPDKLARTRVAAEHAVTQARDGVASNPVPAALGLGTFLLTVAYRKARAKPARGPVDALPPAADAETAVLRRAKARAARTQLVADQIGLENRHRKLPDVIRDAEREACYAEKALADAARALADKEAAHDKAAARLDALRDEKATADAEIAAIAAELNKLAGVV